MDTPFTPSPIQNDFLTSNTTSLLPKPFLPPRFLGPPIQAGGLPPFMGGGNQGGGFWRPQFPPRRMPFDHGATGIPSWNAMNIPPQIQQLISQRFGFQWPPGGNGFPVTPQPTPVPPIPLANSADQISPIVAGSGPFGTPPPAIAPTLPTGGWQNPNPFNPFTRGVSWGGNGAPDKFGSPMGPANPGGI